MIGRWRRWLGGRFVTSESTAPRPAAVDVSSFTIGGVPIPVTSITYRTDHKTGMSMASSVAATWFYMARR